MCVIFLLCLFLNKRNDISEIQNMEKKLTCIDCPRGCRLLVDFNEGVVASVTGNKCPKGEVYAKEECVNPMRVLTTSVDAQGLSLKRVAVKTDKPIPKVKLFDAMQEIQKFKLQRSVECGDILIENFLGLDVNLVSTRRASYLS